MNQLRLEIDGVKFEGWLTVEVERSLDSFAHRFSLRYLDRWQQEPWPIRRGAACTLSYGDELLVTGHVNRAHFRAGPGEWTLSAEGRSATGDLVDCSATHATGSWANRTASQITADLIAPFGLTVKVQADAPDTQLFPRFALEVGESVHSALDRLCKVRALLPITSAQGQVELLQVGTGNVLDFPLDSAIERMYEEDDSERFSAYLLRATGVGSVAEAYVQATYMDPGVARFRPLVVIGDSPSNTAQAKTRATWEANVRAGRSERVRFVMRGLTDGRGLTYVPGRLYAVRDPVLGVDETLVVARAVARVGEKEAVTELEFARPDAYTTLAYPSKLLVLQSKTGIRRVKKTKRGGL